MKNAKDKNKAIKYSHLLENYRVWQDGSRGKTLIPRFHIKVES